MDKWEIEALRHLSPEIIKVGRAGFRWKNHEGNGYCYYVFEDGHTEESDIDYPSILTKDYDYGEELVIDDFLKKKNLERAEWILDMHMWVPEGWCCDDD